MTDQPDARYRARGVSAAKEEVHAAIGSQSKGLYPHAFCKVIPDLLTGSEDHCLVMHADTAGTKASLGYLAWREGLGDQVWSGIAQDALVMNLDDCACVGSVGPYLISNTIGRNAKRIPGAVIGHIIEGYQRLCDDMAKEGIDCIMTGGETADVGDIVRTIDVGVTVTCRMKREEVIDAGRMQPGDVIVGFSSAGQARWERDPNSGIGSNGLTSARHEVLGAGYAEAYPETYAPEIPSELVYCGKFGLGDQLPNSSMTVGQALLSPTRTYLPLIKALVETLPRQDIHGLIHCSGGGQTKIRNFGTGLKIIKDNLPPAPPLFALIKDACGLTWPEMYSVYNMGIRLEAAMPEKLAHQAIAIAAECGIDAQITGHIEAAEGDANQVVIDTPEGHIRYG